MSVWIDKTPLMQTIDGVKRYEVPRDGRWQEQRVAPKDDGNLGQFLGYGFQICAGVLLGLVVGSWLDRKFGWSPWGLLISVLIGLSSGMYLLIRDGIKMNKD